MSSTLKDIVDSIFTPGTNQGLLRAMNASFYALFATLAALLVATRGNVHVVALLTLSVALWASIKWCVLALPLLPSSSSLGGSGGTRSPTATADSIDGRPRAGSWRRLQTQKRRSARSDWPRSGQRSLREEMRHDR